jgi:hypothetical protein
MDRSMPDTWREFSLLEEGGTAKASDLSVFLRDSARSSVRLNAGGLRRMDMMVLQLILCAVADRARRKLGLEMTDVPTSIDAQLGLLGVTQDILKRKVAA